MKTVTLALLAAILSINAMAQVPSSFNAEKQPTEIVDGSPLQVASQYRMYQCAGTQGEVVYADRWAGTDCQELWIVPERIDASGTQITVGRIGIAPARLNRAPTTDFGATPSVAAPGELR